MLLFPYISPSSLLSPCPRVYSLCLFLHCCPVNKFFSTIFLDSTYMHSVQSLSHVQLFATPWTTARQASLSIINSLSLSKLISIESVMPSNHFILCHPLFLLPPIPPSIRVFSNESHYSTIKRNTSESVLMRWMYLTTCYTEWTKSERDR